MKKRRSVEIFKRKGMFVAQLRWHTENDTEPYGNDTFVILEWSHENISDVLSQAENWVRDFYGE